MSRYGVTTSDVGNTAISAGRFAWMSEISAYRIAVE